MLDLLTITMYYDRRKKVHFVNDRRNITQTQKTAILEKRLFLYLCLYIDVYDTVTAH